MTEAEQVRPRDWVLCRDARGHQHVRDRLTMVGDKWSLVVVSLLVPGPLRFTELMRESGDISHRMLTQTLRGLQRDGLVARTAYAEVPPRVVYELTKLGRTLLGPLNALTAWVETHQDAVERHREEYDADPRS